MQPLKINLYGEDLWLLPERIIYRPSCNMFIIADLHFGKTGHFRKAGIAVPQTAFKQDMHSLFAAIQLYKPETILIIGDMFHSRHNKEVELFMKWRNDLSQLNFHLVKGNHDILFPEYYIQANINVSDVFRSGSFSFVHDIADAGKNEIGSNFYFSGHLHPGIAVRTGSRQAMHFPCFYFTKQYAVLPAFSIFSGLCTVKPKMGDEVFAIVKNKVVRIQ